jgi:DNA mismatch repair ATPase MutL
VTDQQEPKTDQQEPKTDQQESKTNQQESKTDQQEPKTDQQEPKIDQQESKTDQQESKTDQQDITKIDQPKIDQQEPRTDQQESKFERVWRFLWEMVSFDESELQIAGHIRAITKWLFDLLRNVLMVGFLFYLAKRTNSSILFIAATAANALLMVYLLISQHLEYSSMSNILSASKTLSCRFPHCDNLCGANRFLNILWYSIRS